MVGISQAAGPEWAYLAPITGSNGPPTDLDSLFVNVIIQREDVKLKPETKILSLQSLCTKQGLPHGPHDVLRFSFARLRELTGTGNLDLLFFYEGAPPAVAIPDESSFHRLLLAVHHLGLAAPGSASARVYEPPVLRFYARPKPIPPWNPWVVKALVFLSLLCLVFVIYLMRHLGPIPVVLGLLFIGKMIDQMMKRKQEQRDDTNATRRDETR